MKRAITAMALTTALALVGCDVQTNNGTSGISQTAQDYEKDMELAITHSLGPFSISVPESWEGISDPGEAVTPESPYEKKPSVGGIMQFSAEGDIDFSDDGESRVDVAIENLKDKGTEITSGPKKGLLSSAVTYSADIEREQEGEACKGFVEFIISGHSMCTILVCVPADAFDGGYNAVLEKVADSIAVDRSSEPLGVEESDSEKKEMPAEQDEPEGNPSSEPAMTESQANALQSALSYVSIMDFSYSGLIDQLEDEGYSTEDATFAVDNCGADWNEEALGSAKSYIDLMAFSYSGLIDQLEYEGFTAEQAKYGADNCGADWNEEAAESAQSYLDIMSFSHSGLIDQLEYEGFTREQAEYGVSTTGL